MSRGLGRIQQECLRVIDMYEAAGKEPTTFNIVAEVYQIKRDRHGNRMCNDTQHTAVKRALAGLRRKGLVTGQQKTSVASHGTRILSVVRSPTDDRAERCCFWRIVNCDEARRELIPAEACGAPRA
jgi:hypothetical protein